MSKSGKNSISSRLGAVERGLARLAVKLETARLNELYGFLSNDRRYLKKAFLAGLARGLGMAVGFTLLGAAAVYVLRLIAQSRLPYIADFISRLIEIIESNNC